MSFNTGPEYCAPDNQRCEALVNGKPQWPKWARQDHRCTRNAVTGRNGFAVCAVHNRKKEVEKWTGGPDAFPHLNRYGKIRTWSNE